MWKKIFRRPVMYAWLVLAICSAMPAQVLAASSGGGNGLRISPVRTDLTINPGTTQVVDVTVTNVTAQTATLQSVINDFVGNPDESGNPALILDPNQYAPSHSLKRYASTVSNFTLNPGQAKTVPVTITIPKDAAAGGYFAAVRFGPSSAGSNSSQITLAGSVGSLMLVKVPGDLKEQLSIASFDVRHKDHPSSFFTSKKDLTATVRFQNLGNVQEEPFGKILLMNHSGKVLASYEVNNEQPPGNVLPDSIRKFSIALDTKHLGSIGQFKVAGNFGYGTSGQLLSASTTFYIIPTLAIIIFAAVVALLAFLVFGLPRLVRAYNRRILRKAGRG